MFFTSVGFSDSDSDEDVSAVTRKYLRNYSNPLELESEIFVKYFRLNKDAFVYLLENCKDKFKNSKSTACIPDIIKIAGCLRFLADGSYQKSVGNDYNVGLAQSTFSLVLADFLNVMETFICSEWIIRMSLEEEMECKSNFFTKFGFPGVVGCIDGTHVNIIAPSKRRRHLYYNRKGFFSINAMIVCDHKMRIRYVDGRNPGANHDSFIWTHSLLCESLQRDLDHGKENFWLLGDSGYALSPFLMTPFRTVQSGTPPANYNKIHTRARNIIERTFGCLKNRFRCILGARQLHYRPEKCTQIINAVCALHNICISFNAPDVINESDYENTVEDVNNADEIPDGSNSQRGRAIRNRIALNL